MRIEVGEGESRGTVSWRRFPTDEPWRQLEMTRTGVHLEATIPQHPPAGKVEYRVTVERDGARAGVPDEGAVVARFRGEVPAGILIPHILAMFSSMLCATRALLEVMRRGESRGGPLVLTAMGLAGILVLTGVAIADEERFKQLEDQVRQNDKELKSLREKLAAQDEKLETAAAASG